MYENVTRVQIQLSVPRTAIRRAKAYLVCDSPSARVQTVFDYTVFGLES
jgi:hypothetical protein